MQRIVEKRDGNASETTRHEENSRRKRENCYRIFWIVFASFLYALGSTLAECERTVDEWKEKGNGEAKEGEGGRGVDRMNR